MPPSPITLLHISDPQFGKNHRFAQQDLSDWDAPFDTLLARLQEDLQGLEKNHDLVPDLLVITGDLAEWGLRSEFEDALKFVRGLCAFLNLPPSRVAIIPGNHDINRKLCESYFSECQGEERKPALPYSPKWKPYSWFFHEFYGDTPGAEFTEELPWSFFEVSDLKIVVAGLNSTIVESHLDDDHYGCVGERQLKWFQHRLEDYRQQSWLRIAAVHHNFRRAALLDDENLRDADDLRRILGDSLNLLLHGHTHEGKFDWIDPSLPVLSTGSTALKPGQRPPEVPNQYQIIRVWPDRVERWTRGFAPDLKSWIGDNRASGDGNRWWDEQKVTFSGIAGTFGEDATGEPVEPVSDPDFYVHHSVGYARYPVKSDDFLSRVETVCRLREPQAYVERIPGTGSLGDYLRVCRHPEGIATIFPVAAIEHGLSMELFERFLSEVDARYRRADPQLISILVYGGAPAARELTKAAEVKRVHLQSFLEYQGLIDFRSYVKRQTRKLEEDIVYPPSLYVPQRMSHQVGRDEKESSDALAIVQEWLSSPNGRFLVLMGDFGTGKTFLLHELARRMGKDEASLIPILLQMRSLEKGRSLDALLAQHFAQEGVEDFSPSRFRYMLEQGRIALLFDGFDELALRVTFDRATEHFDTLLQAAAGAAKVVVTSRRQHFLSDAQVKTALAERAETIPGHRLALLRPFNRDQIRAFLINFCGDEPSAERRMELIDRVKDLLGLSHNPRLLGFIAELPEEQLLEAESGEGEVTAARLYELLLQRWLVGEFERIHPKGAPRGLSVEDRWRGVTALALRLWQKTEASAGLADLTEDAARVIEALQQASLDPAVAAFQLGSGTLLVRDEDGNFSFLHQSILEWIVARSAAEELKKGESPDSLAGREISPLMADFLASLAGKAIALEWTRQVLSGKALEIAKKNALLVRERLAEAVQGKTNLSNQDLRGQDLSYQDLSGADLSRADLSMARLIQTKLVLAKLAETNLVDADLTNAILSRSDFAGANLTGARLMGADLRGASFIGARLRRAKLLASRHASHAFEGCDTFGAAIDLPPKLEGFVSPAAPAQSIVWSRDDQLLVTAEGTIVRIWEIATGRELRRIRGYNQRILSVDLSPDGRTVAGGVDDNTVRLWDVSTGSELQILRGHQKTVRCVAFSHDGLTLASGSDDKTVRLWQLATGREVKVLKGHEHWVWSIAFDPSNQFLVSGSLDQTVRLWDTYSGTAIWVLRGHRNWVLSVAFSPAGDTLASSSSDSTIRIWSVDTGQEMKILQGHENWVHSIAFGSDGRTIGSGSADATIRLWNVSSGNQIQLFNGHNGKVRCLAFSADGQSLASGSDDTTIRLWDVGSGRQIRLFQSQQNIVTGITFSPSARNLASGSYDGTVRLWEVPSGCQVESFEGHSGVVRTVAFSTNGELLASASDDKTIRLWNIHSKQQIHRLRGHEHQVQSVAFSRNGTLVASGSEDKSVRFWDVKSGKQSRVIEEHQNCVWSVAFGPNGEVLASGSDDRTVKLWEVPSGRAVRTMLGHHRGVRSLSFNPSGDLIASGSADSSVRLWDVDSGRELRCFQGHRGIVTSVAFSPDGRSLASGSEDKTIRLWDLSSGLETRRLEGHDSAVSAVAFGYGNGEIASGSYDSTIRLWDASTGACLAILSPLPEGWVAFSPDGRYKLGGIPAGGFWHVINLCRFEAGELDDWVPGLRLPDDASFFDLPPWKPEVRKPESLRRERS